MRRNVPRLVVVAALAAAAILIGARSRAQEVTLPLGQYEDLRARAHPDADATSPPPAPFALESDDVLITVGAEAASVVQTLELAIYGEGALTVPVGEAGSFTAARFGALDGRVDAQPQGWALVVHGGGRYRVTLESVVPLRRDEAATRPTRQLALRLPPAAVVRGRLLAAAPAVDEVELNGAGLLRPELRPEGTRGAGAWSFVAAGGAEPVTFTLRGARTLPERAQLPLRFQTTAATATTVSRTRLRVRGWIEARVAQGRLEELRVPLPGLPEGLELVSVDGPVAGWKVEQRELVVTPLEPIEDSLAVTVTLESKPPASFAVPLLQPRGSHRTLLLARAALEGDGLLDLTDGGAARQASTAEVAGLPPAIGGGGVLYAVLDAAKPPRFAVEWADRSEVLAAQVDRLLVDVAVGDSGRAGYQLWAEVRNRGAQRLAVTLPPGFELVTSSRDGEAIAAGADGDALVVPLAGGDRVQVVHVAGLLPLALPATGAALGLSRSEGFAVPLPALSAPAARVETRLLLPPGRRYALADASRMGPVQWPPRDETTARRNAAVATNLIARQIGLAAGSGLDTAGFFPVPPGFQEIDAAWSALSPSPTPLALQIRSRKEETPWF